jgi:hypothetical protein
VEELIAMYEKQINSAEATIEVLEKQGEYATALEYRAFILKISQEVYFVKNRLNEEQNQPQGEN